MPARYPDRETDGSVGLVYWDGALMIKSTLIFLTLIPQLAFADWFGTDAFSGAAGNAAAPGMTFSTDTASGVFLSSVSNLGFSTAGTQRLLINSSGQMAASPGSSAGWGRAAGSSAWPTWEATGFCRKAAWPCYGHRFDLTG